ncbi:MAG: hypothetical protein ACLS43_03485 [Evtepia gabavorous]
MRRSDGGHGVYRRNRDLFLDALGSMGYTCAQPEGPYLFPGPGARCGGLCERARKYDLILVSGDSFGCPGHVRISTVCPQSRFSGRCRFRALAGSMG